MKNDSNTTLLNFVLYVLVIMCVGFAIWSMWRTQTLRQTQTAVQNQLQLTQANNMHVQALLNDTIAFNATAKNPELAQIIQSAQNPQPAAK